MKRNQTFHETLIPLLVEGIGARSYLEFGTHLNETISRVRCERCYGVDMTPLIEETLLPPGSERVLRWFRMSTQEFIRLEAPKLAPFDFVFIDADHALESVHRDFFGIYPYVSPEGLICLHDTNPETAADTAPGLCGSAWLFTLKLKTDQYESVTLPYHPGLTIVRRRQKWGPG